MLNVRLLQFFNESFFIH